MKYADIIRKVHRMLDPNYVSDAELNAAKPVNCRWEILEIDAMTKPEDGKVIDQFFARTDLASTPWHLPYCNPSDGFIGDRFIQLRKANARPDSPAL